MGWESNVGSEYAKLISNFWTRMKGTSVEETNRATASAKIQMLQQNLGTIIPIGKKKAVSKILSASHSPGCAMGETS